MLAFLPAPVRAALAFLLFILNTLFWCTPLYLVLLVKLIVPSRGWREFHARLLVSIAESWIGCNNAIMGLTQRIEWDVQGLDGLRRDDWYLVSSNHQSWVDIVVLQRVLNRRVPFLKFFIKQPLIWVPVLGGAWWALDFPFMQRHSAAYLAQHPEAREQDWETTRQRCERFRNTPISILNFLEGTRFRPDKHARQQSPYRHLLRPKSGGLAFVLEALPDRVRHLLDVTIVYPDGRCTFQDLFGGHIRRVIVRVRQLTIPPELLGRDYRHDAEFRAAIQHWIGQIWTQKDALIDQLLPPADRTAA
ncbi:MAG TPA: acyltransferase [Candidatus Competibacteraceae bacterium]|nr:acyltransferase [Candidatus Competibacteraceae bacterium]HQA24645.1 acyltransferase [Candidatus Competibacteraceae bacterium]HQD54894.1 acyltransferase [Candidatus Competibacteraceae bacterium]